MERIWREAAIAGDDMANKVSFSNPFGNCADHTLRFSGFAMPPQCLTVICLAHPILKVHLSTPKRGLLSDGQRCRRVGPEYSLLKPSDRI